MERGGFALIAPPGAACGCWGGACSAPGDLECARGILSGSADCAHGTRCGSSRGVCLDGPLGGWFPWGVVLPLALGSPLIGVPPTVFARVLSNPAVV